MTPTSIQLQPTDTVRHLGPRSMFDHQNVIRRRRGSHSPFNRIVRVGGVHQHHIPASDRQHVAYILRSEIKLRTQTLGRFLNLTGRRTMSLYRGDRRASAVRFKTEQPAPAEGIQYADIREVLTDNRKQGLSNPGRGWPHSGPNRTGHHTPSHLSTSDSHGYTVTTGGFHAP